MFLRFSATLGSERPVPGRATLHAPRSPSWARHPLCAGHREGLLCGCDVAPQRGRGSPSGAREPQLFSGGVITKIFTKIHLDITFTTEEHYIIRISFVPVDKAQCIFSPPIINTISWILCCNINRTLWLGLVPFPLLQGPPIPTSISPSLPAAVPLL